MLKRFFKHSCTKPSRPQQAKSRPRLEILEDRLALASRVWDGGSISNNWTNANNWLGNVAPEAGDDLFFPAGISDKVADNNFPADTFFRSITLQGGYTLRGARVLLGNGGIIASGSSNIMNLKVHLGGAGSGTRTIQVAAGSTLFMDDDIDGGNGLNKTGTGNLSFRSNNSYSGLTDIQAGALFIEKDESLGTFGGTANGTVVRNGTTLVVNDTGIGTIRTDENITVEGQGTIRGINDVNLRGNIITMGQTQLRHDGSIIERMLINGQITGPGAITIGTGTGQVWLNGKNSNTYAGATTVFGKLRLDNFNIDVFQPTTSVPNNLTIASTGVVRLEQDDQIADDATVTVQGGGFLLTNEKDDTFTKLKLNGGVISGDKLRINDYLPPLLVNFAGSFLHMVPIISNFAPDRESEIVIGTFEATSSSATVSAQVIDVSIVLSSINGLVQVQNGPAETDLFLYGTMYSRGSEEEGDSILTLEGNGKTLVQDFPTDQYFVQAGELQFAKFQRDLVSPNFLYVEVTVASGAKFTGDVALKQLHVKSGGRVHPGPMNRPFIVDAVYTQIVTGKLSLTEDLIMEPGSILEVQLNNAVAGVGHEQIDVTGSVTVEGALIEPTVGPSVVVGQNYRVINNSGTDAINGLITIPAATGPFLIAAPTGQKLSVNHAGGLLNNDLVLTLQNTAPMAPHLTLSSTEINEGGTVTATGRLVDPDPRDKLRLIVNWGDGTSQELYRPGRDLFNLTHRYRQDGVYTARFEWLDQNNQGNSREFTITVNNVAPALTLRTFRTTSSGILLASGWLSDAGNDRYTATLDFGDGSPVRSKTLQRRDYFAVVHRYQNPGTYTMTVTLRDAQGAESVHERQVIID